MKCYVTISSPFDNDDKKLAIYSSKEGVHAALYCLGKEYVLTHVDVVEDKEKENNG